MGTVQLCYSKGRIVYCSCGGKTISVRGSGVGKRRCVQCGSLIEVPRDVRREATKRQNQQKQYIKRKKARLQDSTD